MSDLTLKDKFDDISREDWVERVQSDLRGKDIKTLTSYTDDDLPCGPLFTALDRPSDIGQLSRLKTPLLEGRPWHICATVRDKDIAFANQQLLADLKGGASAVDVLVASNAISLRNKADIKRLLEGVYLDLVPLRFDMRNDAYQAAELICGFEGLADTHINLGLDPLGLSLAGGSLPIDGLSNVLQNLPQNFTAICVNAALVHEAGGTEAQELSVMAASVVSYWRKFGPQTDLSIRLATHQDGHLTLCKIRAARRIINRLAKVCGADPDIPIHGVSSLRIMQSLDPWTNLLRVMSAGFGGICGGVDYLTLRPFTDAPSKEPRLATPFGYRLARNMQLMMMEESHLGQVADPAFGSYYHEYMSDSLAQAAWTEFQAIETGGGLDSLIESGALKLAITAAKAEREARKDPILGVTLHPADDVKPARLREA